MVDLPTHLWFQHVLLVLGEIYQVDEYFKVIRAFINQCFNGKRSRGNVWLFSILFQKPDKKDEKPDDFGSGRVIPTKQVIITIHDIIDNTRMYDYAIYFHQ